MSSIAILGAGISGLSTAYYLRKFRPDIRLTIFDRSSRAGGVIRTEKIDGFIVESGPDSFLTQKKAGFYLCAELGLKDQLAGSCDSKRKTFVLHEGRLKLLPEGMFLMVPASPAAFLRSDLISWHGKFQALRDLFSLPEQKDCSVADWTEKRFGDEILHQIAEPLLSGIYGCDSGNLSLQSALPQLWDLHQQGSVIIEAMKRRKSKGSQESLFTTLVDGMQTLTDALCDALVDSSFVFNSIINRIEKRDRKWWIQDQHYDSVILASSSLPEIASPLGAEIRNGFHSIRKNSAIVLVLAFRNLYRDGFGWLVPSSERKFALACTYITNKFENRCPEGHFLLRLFIGGREAMHWIDKPDDEIIEVGLKDLERVSGISEQPILSRVYRWPESMPEYEVGHGNRINELKNLAAQEGSLFLAGNSIRGVGIPDCIAQADETANFVTLWSKK